MFIFDNVLEFVKFVNKQRKTNQWYFIKAMVNSKYVELKGYQTWLQVYDVDKIRYSNNCDRKVKEFNQDLLVPFLAIG